MKLSRTAPIPLGLILAASILTTAQAVRADQRQPATTTKKGVTAEGDSPRRPLQLVALADDARSAPPEIAADALIRVAASDKVQDKKWKGELLEEAFRLASSAKHPIRLTYIGGDVDTREGYLSYVLDAQLDALSLQIRAVEAMLAVDKARAREMFAQIPPTLPLDPLGCEASLIYDVSAFYDTLRNVAEKSFSPSDRLRGDHVRFVEPYVAKIKSPAQVGPAAKLIASLKLSPTELATLISSFIAALKGVDEDDRSFSASITANSLMEQFKSLMEGAAAQGLPKTQLAEAFRDMLIRELKGRHCADRSEPGRRRLLSNYVASLNKTFPEFGAVAADDLKPAEVSGSIRTRPYWRSAASAAVQESIKQLRFDQSAKEVSATEKGGMEWQDRLRKLLNDVADWDERQEESLQDYFHQKSVAYRSLIEIAPAGPVRDKIIGDYVRFLSNQPVKTEDPAAWYFHARYLIDYGREAKGEEQARVLKMLRDSNDPALRLYYELDRLVPAQGQTKQLSAANQ